CTCGTTVGLTASIGMTTPDRDGLAWAETASTIIRTEALRYPDLPGAEPVSNFCPTFYDWTRITKAHDLGKATKEELIAQTRMTYNQRDIALVQLSRDLKLPSDTEYAQIGDGALLAAVRAPYVAGFGQNDWQDRGGDKTVIDAIFPPDVCTEGPQSAIDGCQPDIEMRLVDANAGKTDSCAGDSGAGVYVPVEGGHIAVVGVVSRGAESGCGAGGIYALVTDKPVRDWIRKVIPSTGFSNRLVRSDLRLAN
ncbi:MAG: trypsin-like serine protease, partial [Paracoccaceae bacterium]